MLKPGESVSLTVKVTKVKGAKRGSKRTFVVEVTSVHDDAKLGDTVAAVVKVS